jgi:hypothetical protein
VIDERREDNLGSRRNRRSGSFESQRRRFLSDVPDEVASETASTKENRQRTKQGWPPAPQDISRKSMELVEH